MAMAALAKTAVDALNAKLSAEAILYGEGVPSGVRRQAPLVHRFYNFRAKMMHQVVAACVESMASCKSPPEQLQLLLLGGGLDTSYEERHSHLKTYVVDLPEVIQKRREKGVAENTVLMEGDLHNMINVLALLARHGMDAKMPTVVVIECVLSYLKPKTCKAIMSTLASTMTKSVLILYDPLLNISPDHRDGLSHDLHDQFYKRGAGLHCVFPGPAEAIGSLYESGWCHANCITMFQFHQAFLSASDRKVDVSREPFVEHADLALLMQRYGLCLASNNSSIYERLWARLVKHATIEQQRSLRVQALEARARIAEQRLCALTKFLPPPARAEIKLATPADEEKLRALYVRSFAEVASSDASVGKYIKSAGKKLGQFIAYSTESSLGKLFVAWQSGQIVGCIAVKPAGSAKPGESAQKRQSMEITHFCVDESRRRLGIGKSLLQSALQHCQSLGISKVELSVLDKLTVAQALYERQRFKRVEEQRLTPSCTILHLVRDLDEIN